MHLLLPEIDVLSKNVFIHQQNDTAWLIRRERRPRRLRLHKTDCRKLQYVLYFNISCHCEHPQDAWQSINNETETIAFFSFRLCTVFGTFLTAPFCERLPKRSKSKVKNAKSTPRQTGIYRLYLVFNLSAFV